MSLKLERKIKKIEKEIEELKRSLYLVEEIKKDMHNIIRDVVKENIEISIEEPSIDAQIKELLNPKPKIALFGAYENGDWEQLAAVEDDSIGNCSEILQNFAKALGKGWVFRWSRI